jgi:predicted nucleic acid-binding protein
MIARGLVDTDVLIDYLRGVPAAVNSLLALDEVSVSVVSVAELFAGFRGTREPPKARCFPSRKKWRARRACSRRSISPAIRSRCLTR